MNTRRNSICPPSLLDAHILSRPTS